MKTVLKEKARFNYTGRGWEGINYDGTLGIADIAKILRKELKLRFKGCKFSVTIERFSGGQALTISLMEAPFDAFVKEITDEIWAEAEHKTRYNREDLSKSLESARTQGYEQLSHYNIKGEFMISARARAVMNRAIKMAQSFNFSDSDGQIDYFHNNFYLHANLGKWNKGFVCTK